jgi:hypothetical protein
MNTLEDRLRRGLAAEADARPFLAGAPHVSTKPAFRGVAVAFAAAAVMLVAVGGGAMVSRAVLFTGQNPNAAVVPPSISTTAASPLASSQDRADVGFDITALAGRLGAEPVPDAEIQRTTGGFPVAPGSGYKVNEVVLEDPAAKVGLVMFLDDLSHNDDTVNTCFSGYAIVDGVNVAGAVTCIPMAELAARNDDFHIVVEGSCGPFPKDDPRIDGRWMLLSIWGIPIGTVSINVELGDGTVAVVPVSDAGVAQMLWEDPEDILSIQFEAMTPSQRSYASTLLPTPAIDCAPDTDSGSG